MFQTRNEDGGRTCSEGESKQFHVFLKTAIINFKRLNEFSSDEKQNKPLFHAAQCNAQGNFSLCRKVWRKQKFTEGKRIIRIYTWRDLMKNLQVDKADVHVSFCEGHRVGAFLQRLHRLEWSYHSTLADYPHRQGEAFDEEGSEHPKRKNVICTLVGCRFKFTRYHT